MGYKTAGGTIFCRRTFEIEYNVRIGCWYLCLLKEFEGNLPLALAAYNGGRGNVRQWVNQGLWAEMRITWKSTFYRN